MNEQTQTDPGAPSPAPGPETDTDTAEAAPQRVIVVGVEPNLTGVEPREPAEPRKFDVPTGVKGSGRYAFYDTTLGKYVGGVHDTSAKAKTAGKGAASGEVVEV